MMMYPGAKSIDGFQITLKRSVGTPKRERFDRRKLTSKESNSVLDVPPEYLEANDLFECLKKTIEKNARNCLATHCLRYNVSFFEKDRFEEKVLTNYNSAVLFQRQLTLMDCLPVVTFSLKQLMRSYFSLN